MCPVCQNMYGTENELKYDTEGNFWYCDAGHDFDNESE